MCINRMRRIVIIRPKEMKTSSVWISARIQPILKMAFLHLVGYVRRSRFFRRIFCEVTVMNHFVSFVATTLVVLITSSFTTAAEQSRPNVLLIFADDLGYSDIGCYGGEIATPNLDRLASNGLRFRQFYNCTRCCPSRASLLTGLYPHQAGVGLMNADDGHPGYRGFPQPNAVMIPQVLKSVGYHTSMVGKWHLSGGQQTPKPTDRGFDEFYGMIGGFNSFFQEDPFYTRLPAGRRKRDYAKDKFYSTDVFGDYSLDFLAEARTKEAVFSLSRI